MYDSGCEKCVLGETARVVCFPGAGNSKGKVLVIANYPSREDEERYLQFLRKGDKRVGIYRDQRGRLVVEALKEVGIRPSSCYVTYVIKCRPPFDDIATERNKKITVAGKVCVKYLEEEIAKINPDFIICLGKVVQQVVLKISTSIEMTHGKLFDYVSGSRTIPVMPVYDPMQVYKQPDKREAWLTDFGHIRGILLGESPYFSTEKLERFNFKRIDSVGMLRHAVDSIVDGDVVAMDIEATGLDKDIFKPGFKVLSVQFGAFRFNESENESREKVWFVLFDHPKFSFTQMKDWQEGVRRELNRLFTKDCTFVFHNGKYDCKALRYSAKISAKTTWDTMLAHALMHGESSSSLKALAYQVSDLGGYEKFVDASDMVNVNLDDLFTYGCLDIVITKKLYRVMRAEYEALAADNKLKFTMDYLMDISTVFTDIELAGFPFDTATHQDFIDKVDAAYIAAEKDFRGLAQVIRFLKLQKLDELNLNSHPKIRALLFESKSKGGLGLTPTKMSKKTGQPSADAGVLEVLAEQGVEVAEKLHVFRKLSKLKSTFGTAYLDFYNPDTGAIHTNYYLAKVIDERGKTGGAATGRLASARPNLQQIPKIATTSTISGHLMRKSFIASPGQFLVEADLSQIELRIAAMYSRDENMARFFKEGVDFHTRTAAEINGVAMEDVTKKMRQAVKEVNFGILYGMGAPELARRTKMEDDKAKEFLDNYFVLFPELMAWREKTIAGAERDGYIMTLFGRKRTLKFAGYKTEDGAESRQGVNSPIQSSAADVTLYGIRNIWLDTRQRKLLSHLIGSIHDSGIMSVDFSEAATFLPRCVYNMTEPAGLKWLLDRGVPLAVSVEVGNNLLEMKELNLDDVLAGRIDYREIIDELAWGA